MQLQGELSRSTLSSYEIRLAEKRRELHEEFQRQSQVSLLINQQKRSQSVDKKQQQQPSFQSEIDRLVTFQAMQKAYLKSLNQKLYDPVNPAVEEKSNALKDSLRKLKWKIRNVNENQRKYEIASETLDYSLSELIKTNKKLKQEFNSLKQLDEPTTKHCTSISAISSSIQFKNSAFIAKLLKNKEEIIRIEGLRVKTKGELVVKARNEKATHQVFQEILMSQLLSQEQKQLDLNESKKEIKKEERRRVELVAKIDEEENQFDSKRSLEILQHLATFNPEEMQSLLQGESAAMLSFDNRMRSISRTVLNDSSNQSSPKHKASQDQSVIYREQQLDVETMALNLSNTYKRLDEESNKLYKQHGYLTQMKNQLEKESSKLEKQLFPLRNLKTLLLPQEINANPPIINNEVLTISGGVLMKSDKLLNRLLYCYFRSVLRSRELLLRIEELDKEGGSRFIASLRDRMSKMMGGRLQQKYEGVEVQNGGPNIFEQEFLVQQQFQSVRQVFEDAGFSRESYLEFFQVHSHSINRIERIWSYCSHQNFVEIIRLRLGQEKTFGEQSQLLRFIEEITTEIFSKKLAEILDFQVSMFERLKEESVLKLKRIHRIDPDFQEYPNRPTFIKRKDYFIQDLKADENDSQNSQQSPARSDRSNSNSSNNSNSSMSSSNSSETDNSIEVVSSKDLRSSRNNYKNSNNLNRYSLKSELERGRSNSGSYHQTNNNSARKYSEVKINRFFIPHAFGKKNGVAINQNASGTAATAVPSQLLKQTSQSTKSFDDFLVSMKKRSSTQQMPTQALNSFGKRESMAGVAGNILDSSEKEAPKQSFLARKTILSIPPTVLLNQINSCKQIQEKLGEKKHQEETYLERERNRIHSVTLSKQIGVESEVAGNGSNSTSSSSSNNINKLSQTARTYQLDSSRKVAERNSILHAIVRNHNTIQSQEILLKQEVLNQSNNNAKSKVLIDQLKEQIRDVSRKSNQSTQVMSVFSGRSVQSYQRSPKSNQISKLQPAAAATTTTANKMISNSSSTNSLLGVSDNKSVRCKGNGDGSRDESMMRRQSKVKRLESTNYSKRDQSSYLEDTSMTMTVTTTMNHIDRSRNAHLFERYHSPIGNAFFDNLFRDNINNNNASPNCITPGTEMTIGVGAIAAGSSPNLRQKKTGYSPLSKLSSPHSQRHEVGKSYFDEKSNNIISQDQSSLVKRSFSVIPQDEEEQSIQKGVATIKQQYQSRIRTIYCPVSLLSSPRTLNPFSRTRGSPDR